MSHNFMMNASTIFEEIRACNAQVKKSAHDISVAYFMTLNCNSKRDNFAAVLFPIDAMESFAEGCMLDAKEHSVKWVGISRHNAETIARKNGVYRACYWFEGFCPYADLWKDKYGQRATATEEIYKAFLEQIFPISEGYTVEHIGNHREKGWRDLLVRDATGKAILKVEVKARLGRLNYHHL